MKNTNGGTMARRRPKLGDVRSRKYKYNGDLKEILYFCDGRWHWFMNTPIADSVYARKRLKNALANIIREARETNDDG